MENIKNYTLREISKWQGENQIVSLPSLQRGFVWTPNKIEALWDSIFRGYPIGAVLMSVEKNGQEIIHRELLDGQQRSTSIALGFFNPFDESRQKSFFSLKDYLPSVWIDLKPEKMTLGQKFLIRVLTKSHPWGYQINNKTLEMSNRRKAFDYFKTKQNTESYIELTPNNINPWDSYYPVPLAFVLDLENKDEVTFKAELRNKISTLKIRTKHSKSVNYDEVIDDDLQKIYDGLQSVKSLRIPEIQVKAEVLKEEDDTLESESQDPTLFVRLNSSGTQISGEELIYSIYKATFPKSKELIEKIGATFIAPSKLINLFSRLAQFEINGNAYVKIFNINEFRKHIKEAKYKEKLENLISDDATILVEKAIEILRQNKEDLPNILLKQLIVSDIDLFFILLAYVKKHNIDVSNQNLTKEISSNYVHLLWFSIDIKKIYSNLFSYLFIENLSWKNATRKLIEDELLLPLISPDWLRKQLLEIPNTKINFDDRRFVLNETIKSVFSNNKNEEIQQLFPFWISFVHKIRGNKALLLYAQRNYLNEKFKEFNQIENIQDTNRPWDYDHIYPNSWVYNKESINLLVKNWVNTNGNFRALSYDDNRSENNHWSPKQRFEVDEKREVSFIKNDIKYWIEIDHSFNRIKHNDDKKMTIFLNAVLHRLCNIYEEWHEDYYWNNAANF